MINIPDTIPCAIHNVIWSTLDLVLWFVDIVVIKLIVCFGYNTKTDVLCLQKVTTLQKVSSYL
jgi:hypothetical protein